MGYDRRLCADVLRAFTGALTRSLRHRAKRELHLRSVEEALVAAVTVIQRSDSALRLNPHFHTLALDGVYVRDADGALAFHALPEPTYQEVAEVMAYCTGTPSTCCGPWLRCVDAIMDTVSCASAHWMNCVDMAARQGHPKHPLALGPVGASADSDGMLACAPHRPGHRWPTGRPRLGA